MQSKIYCNSKVNNKGERLSLAEEKCKLFWVFLLLSRKKSEEKMRSKNLEVTFCGEFEDFWWGSEFCLFPISLTLLTWLWNGRGRVLLLISPMISVSLRIFTTEPCLETTFLSKSNQVEWIYFYFIMILVTYI